MTMSTWDYRHRLRLAPSSGLSITQSQIEVDLGASIGVVTLASWPDRSLAIANTEWIVINGKASSETEALQHGMAVSGAIRCAFAHLRIAADFGSDAAKGGFSAAFVKLPQETIGRPFLDDEHGLMVFVSEPRPLLAHAGDVTLKLSMQEARFRHVFKLAMERGLSMSEREATAYDFFAAASFAQSPDGRLLSLVMAIETLLDPKPRSADAVEHVQALIALTRDNTQLAEAERTSIVGSLHWLKKESISVSGRKHVETTLGERKYGQFTSVMLWKRAYDLRSRLVHGSVPRPSRDEVNHCAAQLEVMVSHLLAPSLIDVDP